MYGKYEENMRKKSWVPMGKKWEIYGKCTDNTTSWMVYFIEHPNEMENWWYLHFRKLP